MSQESRYLLAGYLFLQVSYKAENKFSAGFVVLCERSTPKSLTWLLAGLSSSWRGLSSLWDMDQRSPSVLGHVGLSMKQILIWDLVSIRTSKQGRPQRYARQEHSLWSPHLESGVPSLVPYSIHWRRLTGSPSPSRGGNSTSHKS